MGVTTKGSGETARVVRRADIVYGYRGYKLVFVDVTASGRGRGRWSWYVVKRHRREEGVFYMFGGFRVVCEIQHVNASRC